MISQAAAHRLWLRLQLRLRYLRRHCSGSVVGHAGQVQLISSELDRSGCTSPPNTINGFSQILIELSSDLLEIDHLERLIRSEARCQAFNSPFVEPVQVVDGQVLERAVLLKHAT